MYCVIIDDLSEAQASELSKVLDGYKVSCNRLLRGATIHIQKSANSGGDNQSEWPAEPVPFSVSQRTMNKDLILEYFDRYSNEDIVHLNTKAQLIDMFYAIYNAPPLSSATKADIVADLRRFYNQCQRVQGFKLLAKT